MNKLVAALLAFSSVVFLAYGQAQPSQPTAPSVPAETMLAKSVGFISVPYRGSDGKTQWVSGTCFFAAVPDDRLGKGKGFSYVVTNRHVATAEGVDPGSLAPEVDLQVNRLEPANGSSVERVVVPLKAPIRWFFPTDDSVDLAVLPLWLDSKAFDVSYLPTSVFVTDMKSEQIGVGDSVFFIGFFLQFPGVKRVEPIYRQGTISMLPVDSIQMSDGPGGKIKSLEHLFLADAHAFHGNSGSPLFVNIAGFRNGMMVMARFPYRLIGIVNGFVPERADIQVTGASTFESSNEPNSGILTFVPAKELLDLLNSPELRKFRDASIPASAKP